MKTFATILALVLAQACVMRAPWMPADLPADLYIDPDMSDERVDAALAAVAWWQDRTPGVIAQVRVARRPEGSCGIYVSDGPTTHAAHTGSTVGCETNITTRADLEGEKLTRALQHELGHAFLGEEHDPTPGNVLEAACTKEELEAQDPKCYAGRGWSAKPSITPEQIARVQGRM